MAAITPPLMQTFFHLDNTKALLHKVFDSPDCRASASGDTCSGCPFSRGPCFNMTESVVASWQRTIASRAPTLPQHAGTCAIVEAARDAATDAPEDTKAIEAADIVIRINNDVVRGFESRVGSRTTYRVVRYLEGVVPYSEPGDNATTILYCVPTVAPIAPKGLDPCWTSLVRWPLLRISPLARFRGWKARNFPSVTSNWAKSVAAALCAKTTVFKVPTLNRLQRPPRVAASVALQVSGHSSFLPCMATTASSHGSQRRSAGERPSPERMQPGLDAAQRGGMP